MGQRMTKLQLVQSILNAMNSDYVTSTTETEESQQVAQILEECYYELLSRSDWAFMEDIRKLEASGSVTPSDTPTTLRIPDKIADIKNIKYDVSLTADTNSTWRDLVYLEPSEFLKNSLSLKDGDSNVVSKSHITTGITLLFRNDKMPDYWTSFDDEYVVFDSYLATEESYVVYTKSIVTGILLHDWASTDGAYPELPAQFFPAFLSMAKARCFVLLKQMASPHDERDSRAGVARLKRLGSKTNDTTQKSNYGRPSSTTRRKRYD